jgi:excinuclease UvrABC nuclease subunit
MHHHVAQEARVRAQILAPARFDRPQSLDKIDWTTLPESPGVYSITAQGGQWLYVGEATNLRSRLTAQFQPAARQAWRRFARDPEVAIFAADLRPLDLLGCRSKAVREHKPRLNVLEPDGV